MSPYLPLSHFSTVETRQTLRTHHLAAENPDRRTLAAFATMIRLSRLPARHVNGTPCFSDAIRSSPPASPLHADSSCIPQTAA